MKKIVYILLGSVFVLASDAKGQMISTVAGNGTPAYSGNGGAATAASLYGPSGIALDVNGNLYIADQLNHCIRKVDLSGNISTVAGKDTAGFAGDSLLATAARLNKPTGVAVDLQGNIFIADKQNNVIRKVAAGTGKIYTIAGIGGAAGYNGDGIAAKLAKLSAPSGVAVDRIGNVYIADMSNHRIRKIDTAGFISSVAGTGEGGFNGDAWPSATLAKLYFPAGVAVDSIGNIYIADKSNNRVRMIDTTHRINTLKGGYDAPNGVAVDPFGNVYVADETNGYIKKIATNFVMTLAGNGATGYEGENLMAANTSLGDARGVAVDPTGVVYTAEWATNRVRKITSTLAAPATVSAASSFSIYPNPSNNGNVTMSISSATQESVLFTVTNVTGQKVLSVAAATNKGVTIKLDQPNGLYFVTAAAIDGSWKKNAEVVIAR